MKTNQNLSGFTLIELLVVVLIIGILASVALPQYQKAVEKARAANVWPILKAVNEAEKRKNLEEDTVNVIYPLDQLDIALDGASAASATWTLTSSRVATSDYYIGLADPSLSSGSTTLSEPAAAQRKGQDLFLQFVNGKKACTSTDNELCKNLGINRESRGCVAGSTSNCFVE